MKSVLAIVALLGTIMNLATNDSHPAAQAVGAAHVEAKVAEASAGSGVWTSCRQVRCEDTFDQD